MAWWGQDYQHKIWAAAAAGVIFSLILIPYSVFASDDSATPLGEALREIARRHKVQIIFAPEAVKDLTAPRISDFDVLIEALEEALEGSGLEFSLIGRNFVIVRMVAPNSDELSDLLEASEIAQRGDSDEYSNTISQYSGVMHGRIISAATQRPLAGVSVSISELNLQAFTDDQGRYRLRGMPNGVYTVTMSYFGLPDETHVIEIGRGEVIEFSQEIGALSIDEITVTGVRSAYQNSVNSHRSVNNIASILAADLNGHYPDDTLAEALRRAPGVSFERDERGGEGEFVAIRGLDARFNSVRINGQSAALIGVFDQRRVALDSFQADSVSKLVVNKSLLPHHPSVGIGGVVDIVTVSPLDSIEREFSLTAEGRYSEFSDKTGYFLRGRYSDRLGRDDSVGVFASASFRRRFLRTYQFDILGAVLPESLPLGPDGTPIRDVDELGPDQLDVNDVSSIEDFRANVFDDRRDVAMVSAGVGWRVSDHTEITVMATYNQRNIDTTRSTTSFEQRDRYTDRNLVTGELIEPETGRFFYFGDNPFLRQRMEVEDQDRRMLIASLDAATEVGKMKARYGGGIARGREQFPLSTEIDFNILDLGDDALSALPVDPVTGRRFIQFDLSNPEIPAPLFTQAGSAFAANPENAQLRDLRIITREVRDRQHSLFFDIDYEVNAGPLQNLQVGFEYASGQRRDDNTLIYNDDNIGLDGRVGGDNNFSLADTVLFDRAPVNFDPIGNPFNGFAGVFQTNRNGVITFRNSFFETVTDDALGPSTDSSFIASTESTFSGYASTFFELTDTLKLRGGLRIEGFRGRYRSSRVVEVDGADFNVEFRADPIGSQERSTLEVLPRFTADYRLNDKLLLKASIFESIARPRFTTLGRSPDIEIDLEEGTALISTGNIDTPNIKARNYDLSLQYFGRRNSFFEVNAYYKAINNFRISTSGASSAAAQTVDSALLADYLPNNFQDMGIDISDVTQVAVRTPIEGVSAEAYGVDFSILHQFDADAGLLDGVGVRVSGGLQHTNFIIDNGRQTPRESEFNNAPTFAGTASLWYQRHALSAYAIYSYQGRQLNSAELLFPDEFVQPYSALDLRLQYNIADKADSSAYAFYITASDILDNGLKPTTHETIGPGDAILDDIEFNGREIRFGIQASF